MFWIVMAVLCGVLSIVNAALWARGGQRAANYRRAAIVAALLGLITLGKWAAHTPV